MAGHPTVYNNLTNTSPLVLHFNGGAKHEFGRYRDHLLSGVSCERIRAYRKNEIDTPNGPIPFATICPESKFPLPASVRLRCGDANSGQASRTKPNTIHQMQGQTKQALR